MKEITDFKKLLRIESTDYYPLVYIPNRIKELISDDNFYKIEDNIIKEKYNLSFPNSPSVPKKPKEPSNYKNIYVTKTNYEDGFGSTLFWGILFSILSLYSLAVLESVEFFFICLFIAIILFFVLKSKYHVTNNLEMVKLNEEEEKIEKENYEVLIKKYDEEMENYKIRYESYKSNLQFFNEYYIQPSKNKYIYEKYLQQIKSILSYERIVKQIKKGKVENFFLEKLLKIFIEGELKIDIAVKTYNSAFYPDFLYESKDNGFCIDIEIDEQYDFESKKPIHYIGADNLRNNFFLDKNCFILRFTEEQIIDHPDECCLFIKELIKVIFNPQIHDIYIHLKKVKPWTYEEAYLKGLSNTRRYT